ncbi:hypothetical protein FRC01_012882 [Tulasnella sp. 417]|nr:hypothetical protein FRC01_012882 [Tulasnella sp. 417]
MTFAYQPTSASAARLFIHNIESSDYGASARMHGCISALEFTPSAQAKTGTTNLAVTGCSRDGKNALMVGASETCVALTALQESGSRGEACWRILKDEEAQGSKVQPAAEVIRENLQFNSKFNNYLNNLNQLLYDNRLLPALARASCDDLALGAPDNTGFEKVSGYSHCESYADAQWVLNKLVFGQGADTSY